MNTAKPFWVTYLNIRESQCNGRWYDLPSHEGGRNEHEHQAREAAEAFITKMAKEYNEPVICRVQDDEYNVIFYVYPKGE